MQYNVSSWFFLFAPHTKRRGRGACILYRGRLYEANRWCSMWSAFKENTTMVSFPRGKQLPPRTVLCCNDNPINTIDAANRLGVNRGDSVGCQRSSGKFIVKRVWSARHIKFMYLIKLVYLIYHLLIFYTSNAVVFTTNKNSSVIPCCFDGIATAPHVQ